MNTNYFGRRNDVKTKQQHPKFSVDNSTYSIVNRFVGDSADQVCSKDNAAWCKNLLCSIVLHRNITSIIDGIYNTASRRKGSKEHSTLALSKFGTLLPTSNFITTGTCGCCSVFICMETLCSE